MYISSAICILALTACGTGNHPEQGARDVLSTKTVANQVDPIVNFQKEVIPVIESALIKQFPNKEKTGIDDAAFNEQADYYFDNDDVNNPKVVFLVDKEDTNEMKAIRKELDEKLGKKVVFKKARHNPKVLRNMVGDIDKYLRNTLGPQSSYSVGYNPKEEVIDIKGKLTDKQVSELKQKFSADMLKITNEEINAVH